MMAACVYRGDAPGHPTSAATAAPIAPARTAGHGALVTTAVHAPEPDAGALVATASPLADAGALASADPPSLFVAGCNVGCVDCGLGSYRSVIVGTLDRTGEQLFPAPDPPAPGYACGARVAIGERVTLRARTTEGLVIASWSGFHASDACPCAGTSAMTCTFVVTPEIASHHERIYCGATWKQQATAQIGE